MVKLVRPYDQVPWAVRKDETGRRVGGRQVLT